MDRKGRLDWPPTGKNGEARTVIVGRVLNRFNKDDLIGIAHVKNIPMRDNVPEV